MFNFFNYDLIKVAFMYFQTKSSPGLIEELDGEADDLVIGDNSLILVRHLATVLM